VRNAHPVSQNAGKKDRARSWGLNLDLARLGGDPSGRSRGTFSFSRFGKLSPNRVLQNRIHHDWIEILLSWAYAAGDQGPNGVGMEEIWGLEQENRLRWGLDKTPGSEREVGCCIPSFFSSQEVQKKG
jgi:hypothetical protein